jgi:hypothetical protein
VAVPKDIQPQEVNKLIADAERARLAGVNGEKSNASDTSFRDANNCDEPTPSPRNPYRAKSGMLLTTDFRRCVRSVVRGLTRDNDKLPENVRITEAKIIDKAAYLLGV